MEKIACFNHEGARFVHIEPCNDMDRELSFAVCFDTPAHNDAGAAHLIEHVVLCGSEAYRGIDPFNELSKNTIHIYLNAITFNDKTIYPFSTYIDIEYFKMLDVYFDAVFNPVFDRDTGIFFNEKRIVHSEMQDSYIRPEYVIKRLAYRELFKNTPAMFDAAGVPEMIERLSLGDCVLFHRQYYTAHNATVYLYGNLDIDAVVRNFERRKPFKSETVKEFSDEFSALRSSGAFNLKQDAMGLCYKLEPIGGINSKTLFCLLERYYAMRLKRSNISVFFESETGAAILCFCAIGMNRDLFLQTVLDEVEAEIDVQDFDRCATAFEFYLKDADFGYRPRGIQYFFDLKDFGALDASEYIEPLRNIVKCGGLKLNGRPLFLSLNQDITLQTI